MPISSEEFTKGKALDGPSKKILDFLTAHPEQAFTDEEIIQAGNGGRPVEAEHIIKFLAALAPLQFGGLVEGRLISKGNKMEFYYRAAKRD